MKKSMIYLLVSLLFLSCGATPKAKVFHVQVSFPKFFSGAIKLLVLSERRWLITSFTQPGGTSAGFNLTSKMLKTASSIIVFNDMDENGRQDPYEAAMELDVKTLNPEENLNLDWPYGEDRGIFPQSALINLNPGFGDDDELAEKCVLVGFCVLDHEVFEANQAWIKKVFQNNPETIFLAYFDLVNVGDWVRSSFAEEYRSYLEQQHGWMPGVQNGVYVDKIVYWPNAGHVNFTANSANDPSVISQMLVDFFQRTKAALPEDVKLGFYLDDMWDDEWWVALSGINGITLLDSDGDLTANDGEVDPQTGYYKIDLALQKGWSDFLTVFRKNYGSHFGVPPIVIGNEANDKYYGLVDGKWFEGAPNITYLGDWNGNVQRFQEVLMDARDTKTVWETVMGIDANQEEVKKECFNAFLLANLLGGYHACTASEDHSRPIVLDEYNIPLGKRVPGYRILGSGLWLAVFEQGIILFNPTDIPKSVALKYALQTIAGGTTTNVALPAKNGTLLLF